MSSGDGHDGPAPAVLVVGTGAMACLFAARMQRFGGARVTMTGTWTEALAAVSERGLQVEDEWGSWPARPAIIPRSVPRSDAHPDERSERSGPRSGARSSPLPPVDLALVLVKSTQTADVAPAVARALAPHGHVLTLQNGLGNRETLEAMFGAGRVSAGVATLGSTLLGPGHVRATAGEVILGAGEDPPAGLVAFERLLVASRFTVRRESSLTRTVWRKLAVNCAINPLSALLGCPNGELLQAPEPRESLLAAAREVGAVATALGIDLGTDPADLVLEVAATTATNRSSMLQDLSRGAPTEIESLNGAVVAEARRLGISVPVNESLLFRVRAAGSSRAATEPARQGAEPIRQDTKGARQSSEPVPQSSDSARQATESARQATGSSRKATA